MENTTETTVSFKHSRFNEIGDCLADLVKRYSGNYVSDWEVKVTGNLTGSYNWNHMYGYLLLTYVPYNFELFRVNIEKFTDNCGIKALRYPYIFDKIKAKECMEIIESFLWYKTNAGIVVGSDHIGGRTHRLFTEFGYNETPPIHNPNYTWNPNHKITILWKNLDGANLYNYWG